MDYTNEKTLIGKNGWLFLKNDSAKELDIHCNNLCSANIEQILYVKKTRIENYYLVVFPDKSVICCDFLPDTFCSKYRPMLDLYVAVYGDKLLDCYKFLKNDAYYKTDTHINAKGGNIVYRTFIENINKMYKLDLKIFDILLKCENTILSELQLGIGDLTWDENLGMQCLENKYDTFYRVYMEGEEISFYNRKNFKISDYFTLVNYNLDDVRIEYDGKLINWELLSNVIIKIPNDGKKVIIFYDSFLVNMLSIYMDTFKLGGFETYFIKNIYQESIICKIQPDFVFEFRIERFLL